MRVIITSEITNKLPRFNILALSMKVNLFENDDLSNYIQQLEQDIHSKYTLSDLLVIPLIKAARDGYKTLGKDPSHCHLAVESLFRRIIKGNHLYKINNVVDAGNVLSLVTMCSTAILDYDKIVGDVVIRLGTVDDCYEGIGRGKINVSRIPLYQDDVSPFGCPTSDTTRTMITEETNKILVMIICFEEIDQQKYINNARELFEKYCLAYDIEEIIVERK